MQHSTYYLISVDAGSTEGEFQEYGQADGFEADRSRIGASHHSRQQLEITMPEWKHLRNLKARQMGFESNVISLDGSDVFFEMWCESKT